MRNAGFIMICVVALISSCSDSATKSEVVNKDSVTTMSSDSNTAVTPTKPAPDTVSAPKVIDWAGNYKTDEYPGYDMTEIMLHNDSTYMYSAKYHGNNERTVKLKGKFSFTGAGAIRLENAKDEPADYLLKENELTQVNKDPKSEVVITLKKEKK